MQYKLVVPFRVLEGKTIESLSIREHRTVGDLIAVEREGGGPHNRDVTMASRLTGLTPDEIMSIDADRDWPVIVHMIERAIAQDHARAAALIAELPSPKADGLPAPK